jgi:hypothetical protein
VPRPEDTRAIEIGKFRERRAYLADHCFAEVGGSGSNGPSDLIKQDRWEHMMDLATDVVLRTTDDLGLQIRDMQQLALAWLEALPPDPELAPFAYDPYLDAHDEFEAAIFIAAHGWYRQAAASLRNALEGMVHATRYSVRGDRSGYQHWRSSQGASPKMGNSFELIQAAPGCSAIERKLSEPEGLFGANGVFRALYSEVSGSTHSESGYKNADIWRSNGPVFIPRAFTELWSLFIDVILACWIFIKIMEPSVKPPSDLAELSKSAGESWHGLAPAAIDLYFA